MEQSEQTDPVRAVNAFEIVMASQRKLSFSALVLLANTLYS